MYTEAPLLKTNVKIAIDLFIFIITHAIFNFPLHFSLDSDFKYSRFFKKNHAMHKCLSEETDI